MGLCITHARFCTGSGSVLYIRKDPALSSCIPVRWNHPTQASDIALPSSLLPLTSYLSQWALLDAEHPCHRNTLRRPEWDCGGQLSGTSRLALLSQSSCSGPPCDITAPSPGRIENQRCRKTSRRLRTRLWRDETKLAPPATRLAPPATRLAPASTTLFPLTFSPASQESDLTPPRSTSSSAGTGPRERRHRAHPHLIVVAGRSRECSAHARVAFPARNLRFASGTIRPVNHRLRSAGSSTHSPGAKVHKTNYRSRSRGSRCRAAISRIRCLGDRVHLVLLTRRSARDKIRMPMPGTAWVQAAFAPRAPVTAWPLSESALPRTKSASLPTRSASHPAASESFAIDSAARSTAFSLQNPAPLLAEQHPPRRDTDRCRQSSTPFVRVSDPPSPDPSSLREVQTRS
jgi:hypothetical protein